MTLPIMFHFLLLMGQGVAPSASISAPVTYSPSGTITTATPTFYWNSVQGASSYTISVHRASEDNYEFEVTVPGTNFRPGSLADATPGSNSNPVVTEPTFLMANTEYNWWVRANDSSGNPGPWSVRKTFEYVDTSLLSVGLHSHVGYPREVGAEVDRFNAYDCNNNPTGEPTNWANMDNTALVNHANSFGSPFFVHSGMDWVLYYRFGWRSYNKYASSQTIYGLNANNMVLHPITIPAPITGSSNLGDDIYGNQDRKTLALIGEVENGREGKLISADPLLNNFGFIQNSRDLYYRFRVPGMFDITRSSDGQRPTDADLYEFTVNTNGYLDYTHLTFSEPTVGSFEAYVGNQFDSYHRIIRNAAGSKAKYLLLGNEPEVLVPIHPQIYARLIARAHELFAQDDIKIVLGNFANGPKKIAYLNVMMNEFRAIYGTDKKGDILYQDCPFQASSIDFYLDDDGMRDNGDRLNYEDIALQVGEYKAKVQEIRDLFISDNSTTVDFFIKEVSFSKEYYCKRPGLLGDVNSLGTGASLPFDYKEEIKTLISFFKQLGFQNIGWFNHFRTPAEHGDLMIGTQPSGDPDEYETKLGNFLRTVINNQ